MSKDYEAMSIDDLEAELQDIDVRQRNLREEALEVHAVLDTKIEALLHERKLSEMAERRREVYAKSIPSEEKVS